MNNARIAEILDEMADILEVQGANSFRVRAYRNGARAIRDLTESVQAVLDDPDRKLTDIDGIGTDLAEKCSTLVQTGELPQHQKLLKEMPESLLALLRIPGLGPKKANKLHKQLGITTLDELKAACEAGQVRELKGFGAKTEASILAGMTIAKRTKTDRLLWADADQIAQQLREHLQKCEAIQQLELAGSYRRGRETIGDLDVLVVSAEIDAVMDHFEAFPRRSSTIVRGETKMSIRLEHDFQVDLRVVPAESFGAALQYFTGSKEHNVQLRGLARQRGLKVNEYGVFRVDGESEKYLAGRTEQEVYATLELPCFPPELREARGEFDWDALPTLVTLEDICGDLHMHTDATDGRATLEEMVEAARQRGLRYVAITDHSQRVSMAMGLDGPRLLEQWEKIDAFRETISDDFQVLKGIEVDILEGGGLDLPDDVLAQADWVIASIHYGQKQPREQLTARMVEALENPHVSAIAHPTGRLLNRRGPYDIDMDQVLETARRCGKLLELNSHPRRLDLNDVYCARARELGIPIVINSDAHSVRGLDVMRYGILQARRAGLRSENVANTRPWEELRTMIGKSEG